MLRRLPTPHQARRLLAAFAALTACGTATISATPVAEPGEYRGESGAWLRNASIELFVTGANRTRILVLQSPGGENLLRSGAGETVGIKTWILLTREVDRLRARLSERPGDLAFTEDGSVRIKGTTDPVTGLRLDWSVSIEPDQPVARLTQRIHNDGTAPYTVAIWSLAAFNCSATLYAEWPENPPHYPHMPYSILVYPWASIGDARLFSDDQRVGMRLDAATATGSAKIGLFKPDGTVFADVGSHRIRFTLPTEERSLYPEGGSNITLYAQSDPGTDCFGEAENIDALKIVMPGEFIEATLEIELTRRD